jgi:glutamate synthase domain-containing protein 2
VHLRLTQAPLLTALFCLLLRPFSVCLSIESSNQETHETLAVAMNRLGARSNTGEGGEDPVRDDEEIIR